MFLPRLQTNRLRLEYIAVDRVRLPLEEVSVWRGLIGRYVRRISPQLNEFFFETPCSILRPLDHLSSALRGRLGLRGSHVPHPFVLRSPVQCMDGRGHALAPGETYTLELTLIEGVVRYLPLLSAMFDDLGLSGVGHKVRQRNGVEMRGRMRLACAALVSEGIECTVFDGNQWKFPAEPVELHSFPGYRMPESAHIGSTVLDIRFGTPLRLYRAGKPVDECGLTPRDLTEAVFRRYYGLACCYAPQPPEEDAMLAAKSRLDALAAETELVDAELCWSRRNRYSGRQRATVSTGGIVGWIRLKAAPDDIALWNHLLQRIEPVHLGKGTSFGQGGVVVEHEIAAVCEPEEGTS